MGEADRTPGLQVSVCVLTPTDSLGVTNFPTQTSALNPEVVSGLRSACAVWGHPFP